MEVGVYSGGSLPMWRNYLGPNSHIYGIDIEPTCSAYKTEGIDIIIGDQGSREFWTKVKKEVQAIDVFIDDGSHLAKHQIVTLEEMLPHLAPGGIYICEDVHWRINEFAAYASALAWKLNGRDSNFSRMIHSVHLYPFLVIIEKTLNPREPLTSLRRGTQWQPFMGEHDGVIQW
jgi:hypothetical protein